MIWVFGASGAIGQAMLAKADAEGVESVGFFRKSVQESSATYTIVVGDLLDESKLSSAIEQALDHGLPDQILIATGLLHNDEFQPEKTFKTMTEAQLLASFRVNTVLPSLIVKHCIASLPKRHALNIGILSARIGSISDNRMGGWHSYRASKAALNMLVKNFALEFTNKYPNTYIIALQPGTTDSALSKPFQSHLPDGQLQTPQETAEYLWKLLASDLKDVSGELIDFQGQIIAP
ncbi:SDR family NAD(P)-dependent oxidoreductase [Hydrogenovibrio halophilus]|uniref:SDR family NAD(P)-dependent oxidoreductase n=1 Tax=Hydrogenovibrio halophilus TaxID=373391 RepID=UPI00048F22CD|nr:SDR family NAD(P)-dependent oxidoreductase [Hydrogenovibrio halophilus]